MKKILSTLSILFLFSSCIVIKVYDTPKDKDQAPKVIAKKRMMLPSDRTIPLPTGEQEILFFGEDFPPTPEVFHYKTDDSLAHLLTGDSLVHKATYIIKLDDLDSMPQGMNFQWKSKAGAMHHAMPMMKECCKMSPKECAAMDSLCSPMMMGKMHAQKSIHVIKMDAKKGGEKNTFVIKTKGGDDKKAPLIIIDGEEKAAGFDLQAIAPDQIESINVLKDEAAFKQVGEKGANGVIMIKMKKQ